MNNWIKKASIILMVLVFFISSTGFTLYIHICDCMNTTKRVVFNELIKSKPICCCERFEKLPNSKQETNINIDNKECCQNKHLLIKSSSYMLPIVTKLSEDKSFTLLSYFIPTKTIYRIENKANSKKLASHYFPPPLLYGRSLIILFNQFKIPLFV